MSWACVAIAYISLLRDPWGELKISFLIWFVFDLTASESLGSADQTLQTGLLFLDEYTGVPSRLSVNVVWSH